MKCREGSEHFRQMANKGLIKKLTFDKKKEGRKEASHTNTPVKSFPGRGTSKQMSWGKTMLDVRGTKGRSLE